MSKLSDIVSAMPNLHNIDDLQNTVIEAKAAERNTLIAANLAAGAIAATGDKKYAENPDEAIVVFDLYFKALQARG